MDRTLDRLPQFDERSRNFPITAVVNTSVYTSKTWPCEIYNDQGEEGACVGFGWSHELASEPAVVPTNYDVAFALYKRAQALDSWPGDNYSGTSVLAGAKAVQELRNNVGVQYMPEYRWAFGLSDLLLALAHQGPVVLGLNWYTGMFNVDSAGYLRVSGDLAGGHCLLAVGVYIVSAVAEPTSLDQIDLDASYVILHNSWGRTWGIGGKCKMTLRDMQRLLNEQGEACVQMVRNVDQVIVPADPVGPSPAPVKPGKSKKYFSVRNSTVYHDFHPGLLKYKEFDSVAEARRLRLRPCSVCKPS